MQIKITLWKYQIVFDLIARIRNRGFIRLCHNCGSIFPIKQEHPGRCPCCNSYALVRCRQSDIVSDSYVI
jgi:rRNA maturation endonuclease Nob1